ncbi:MAG TPA: hypothetical protein VGR87_10055 [Candidatus Limnocylindria bacterium]|jgi:hypothetical protein|nr:hypothetical protein [Candidatus Limnocylindria bacterium]
MRSAPVSSAVFAVVGAALLVGALILAILGSFAYLAAASVGLFFIAAALVSRAALSRAPGVLPPAILALAGIALVVFGMVATPMFYFGLGLLVGAMALALLGYRARPTL